MTQSNANRNEHAIGAERRAGLTPSYDPQQPPPNALATQSRHGVRQSNKRGIEDPVMMELAEAEVQSEFQGAKQI